MHSLGAVVSFRITYSRLGSGEISNLGTPMGADTKAPSERTWKKAVRKKRKLADDAVLFHRNPTERTVALSPSPVGSLTFQSLLGALISAPGPQPGACGPAGYPDSCTPRGKEALPPSLLVWCQWGPNREQTTGAPPLLSQNCTKVGLLGSLTSHASHVIMNIPSLNGG